jgi:murein DD-endopeptidase MepM/ murein hydrolase activator NlpD
MIHLLLAFQLAQAPDTTLFPRREELLRLYTNCDESRWPFGTDETFVTKTSQELLTGVARRHALEEGWRRWFLQRAGDTLTTTPADSWVYPLPVRGHLVDNFRQPGADGTHEALDIFVPREGVEVRAPVSGVVIAAGDDWKGGWKRHVGLEYQGDGLSRRAGNGVILFDPAAGAYIYLVHMLGGSVAVHAGDVVRAGRMLGRVGHSGNASAPGHGRHLHIAYKVAGTGCSVDGVLVAANPFRMVRAARERLYARAAGGATGR